MKPDICTLVGVCTGCEHWQVDITPRSRSEHGGMEAVLLAVIEVHSDHVFNDCVGGPEGRVLFRGEWVERPRLANGNLATGVLVFQPLPRWWVWR